MNLVDVNILIYAFRADSPRHADYSAWLDGLTQGDRAFGMSERVLLGFMRIVTHRKVFSDANTMEEALAFTESLLTNSLCRDITPGDRHWPLFSSLCVAAAAHGNLVSDAWYAALAIEHGCTWVTTDRDFARFPGLTWQHSLDHSAPLTNPTL